MSPLVFLADPELQGLLRDAALLNELRVAQHIEVTAWARDAVFSSGDRNVAARQAWSVAQAAETLANAHG